MNPLIGKRIRNYRIHKEVEPAKLVEAMGLADEAELTRIENAEQAVTAAQIMKAIEVLGTTIDDMTDPFRLEPGEAKWTWRIRPQEDEAAA